MDIYKARDILKAYLNGQGNHNDEWANAQDALTVLVQLADKYLTAYDYCIDNGRIDEDTGEWI